MTQTAVVFVKKHFCSSCSWLHLVFHDELDLSLNSSFYAQKQFSISVLYSMYSLRSHDKIEFPVSVKVPLSYLIQLDYRKR